MRKTLLLVALASLVPSLRADRFYFGTEADDKKFKGLEGADVRSAISGVMLREQNGMAVIRVEGGEVWVERKLIYRVEKDALTVAQLEERERGPKAKPVAAGKRAATQVAEASGKRAEAAPANEKPAEPGSKALTLEIDFEGLLPGYKLTQNSDVLRKVDLVALSREVEDWLRENGVEPKADAKKDFTINVDFKGLLPAYGFSIYDPVIHRVDLRGLARQVEDYLRAEVERAANRGKRKIAAN